MSARKGVVVSVKRDADGGVSPNRKVPLITAEMRAFWPDTVTVEDVQEAIQSAADQAMEQVRFRMEAT